MRSTTTCWDVVIALQVLAVAAVVVVFFIGVNAKVKTVGVLHRKLRVEMTVAVLVATVGSLCRVIAATNHVVVNYNAGAESPQYSIRAHPGSTVLVSGYKEASSSNNAQSTCIDERCVIPLLSALSFESMWS